ncbi:MAG: hypothetical protein IJY15_02580, partial [Thermoguttaceae bacterium]|nr:hypothetical protein [Thermoguttaceae bacterium]
MSTGRRPSAALPTGEARLAAAIGDRRRAPNGRSALSGGDWRPSDALTTGEARLAAAIGDR